MVDNQSLIERRPVIARDASCEKCQFFYHMHFIVWNIFNKNNGIQYGMTFALYRMYVWTHDSNSTESIK